MAEVECIYKVRFTIHNCSTFSHLMLYNRGILHTFIE